MNREQRRELSKLLARLADGDRDAFRPAFAQLWPQVRGFAGRVLKSDHDADDAASGSPGGSAEPRCAPPTADARSRSTATIAGSPASPGRRARRGARNAAGAVGRRDRRAHSSLLIART